jgi:hypothetical protein
MLKLACTGISVGNPTGAWGGGVSVAAAAGVGLASTRVGGRGVGAAGVAVAGSTVEAGGGVDVTAPAAGVWVGISVVPSWANTTLKLAEAKTKMTSNENVLNHNDLAAIPPPHIQLSSA